MSMRRVLLRSSAMALAATPLVAATSPPGDSPDKQRLVCRPSELPIYPAPKPMVSKVEVEQPSSLEQSLLEPVGFVREGVVSAVQQAKGAVCTVGRSVKDTTDNFQFIVTYLREEDNEAQRIGAMAMGTLTGFIFGLRGGFIKRITYSLIGAGAMGSVCYPVEAAEYYKQSKTEGKLLVNVVYNFIYGVKPGDPQPEINFPEVKIPTSFSEFSDMALGLGKSVKDALMPPTAAVKPAESPKKE